MENLRRATIYATKDPAIAHDLLKALINRALSTTPTAAAWFEAGYAIEAYKQALPLRGANGRYDRAAWAAVDETLRVDGYGFVKKAIAMGGPTAEMEFCRLADDPGRGGVGTPVTSHRGGRTGIVPGRESGEVLMGSGK